MTPRLFIKTATVLALACFAMAALTACKASIEAEPPAPSSPPAERTEKVTAGALNVREQPSSNAKILGIIYKDQLVTVLGRENNWIRIRSHKDGLSGWVYGAYLTGFNIPQPSRPTQSAEPAQPADVPDQTQQDADAAMDEISGTVETDDQPAPEPVDEPSDGTVQPLNENEIEGSPHGTTI